MSGVYKMDGTKAEDSLFVRALYNIYELLEKMHLEDEKKPLTNEAKLHYEKEITKNYKLILLVARKRRKDGITIKMPFIGIGKGNA